jgi:hypothetical protein
LWTTGEKVGFSKAHCEVQKQPNLDLSFRDLNPSPLLKSNLHIKSLELEPWPPGSFKRPTFPKIPTRKGKTLSFVIQISSQNKSDVTFGNYFGFQKKEKYSKI